MLLQCMQISEEALLGSTYTKTGKVLTTAATSVCFISLYYNEGIRP